MVLLLFTTVMFGQDPQLSQSFSAPMYVNPAFTGLTIQDRLVLNYRSQWARISNGYRTYAFSYDHNIKSNDTGIGISLLNDKSGINGLRYTSINMSFAKEFRIKRSFGIRTGLSFGNSWLKIDSDKLVFWDQIYSGTTDTDIDGPPSKSYFDASAGILAYTSDKWIGVSLFHINKPSNSLLNRHSRLPIRLSVHAGIVVPIAKDAKGRPYSSFKPVIFYKRQDKWSQSDIGAYFQVNKYFYGILYRGVFSSNNGGEVNKDSFVFLAGLDIQDQIKLGYSYDVSIGNLTGRTGGAHEISVIYQWYDASGNKKVGIMPCPSF